jgi:drug/metabolite transporter (DMT)-like permease
MNVLTKRAEAPARPLAGALWMLASGLSFVGVTASVKYLGDSLPASQAAFLRYALGLVFVLPFLGLLVRERPSLLDLKLFALRGLLHTGAVALWFYSMTRIPLAEVTAMGYLTPVLVTLGAALFLGERLRLRRVGAVAAAILGALIILRPGVREIADGHLAMIATAMFFAVSYLVAKPLTMRHSASVVVAMLSITVTLGLAPLAALVWVPVTWAQVGGLFLIASFATAGHYAMTLAFAAAPISVTQPVTALQLFWSVLIGSLFFGESVDIFVILGGGVIVGAVVFIALRERAAQRATDRRGPGVGNQVSDRAPPAP